MPAQAFICTTDGQPHQPGHFAITVDPAGVIKGMTELFEGYRWTIELQDTEDIPPAPCADPPPEAPQSPQVTHSGAAAIGESPI